MQELMHYDEACFCSSRARKACCARQKGAKARPDRLSARGGANALGAFRATTERPIHMTWILQSHACSSIIYSALCTVAGFLAIQNDAVYVCTKRDRGLDVYAVLTSLSF